MVELSKKKVGLQNLEAKKRKVLGTCLWCFKSNYNEHDNSPTRSLGASSLTVESDLEKFLFKVVA